MIVGSVTARVRNLRWFDRDEQTAERLCFQLSSRRFARNKWTRTWIDAVIWHRLSNLAREQLVEGIDIVAFGEIVQNEHTRALEMKIDHYEVVNRQPSQKVTFTIQPQD